MILKKEANFAFVSLEFYLGSQIVHSILKIISHTLNHFLKKLVRWIYIS